MTNTSHNDLLRQLREIESELDAAGAPRQIDGRSLTLSERVAALAFDRKSSSYINVGYDDKGDCLYVSCNSNEPATTDEDALGILHRYALSDGRRVGVTIQDFMGRKSADSGKERSGA